VGPVNFESQIGGGPDTDNLGESEDHVAAVACAICNRDGALRGAITVAAPDTRLSNKDFPRVAKIVEEATRTVGAALLV
jgi:DNA-binding IclR family transcriptional regulator